jgi:hypothetical protein
MIRHLFLAAGILAVFGWLAGRLNMEGPYGYDEADYMYAAGQGVSANWLDSPSIPLMDFIEIGMGRGRDSGHRGELSESIRVSNDILFYRHWHGPIYIDWLDFLSQWTVQEGMIRRLNHAVPALTAMLIYVGALWLIPAPAGGTIAAVLGASLYLWGAAVFRSNELAPHQLFSLFVVAALLCLAKWWCEPESRRDCWYAAVAFTAVACCVLEVGFALVLTLLICGWAARGRFRADWAWALRSLALFAGVMLAVWPAAIFKLSLAKSYLFMAYLAIFRRNSWGSSVGAWETWLIRVKDSPVVWIVFAFGVVYCFRNGRTARLLTPLATFSLCMILALVRVNSEIPRYVIPILPGIVMLGAFATAWFLAGMKPRVRLGATVAICAVMLVTSWMRIRLYEVPLDNGFQSMVDLAGQYAMPGKPLLVPQEYIPTLHYYYPKASFRGYLDEAVYAAELRSGRVSGAITRDAPPRFVAP